MLAAPHRTLTALVVALTTAAAAAVAGTLPAAAVELSGSSRAAGGPAPVLGCQAPLLHAASRGSAVKTSSPDDFAAAALVNDMSVRELAADVSEDRTLWLDRCGQAFYVEPAITDQGPTLDATLGVAETLAEPQSGAPTDPGALSSALLLESKPGASKTIYLDFNGGTVTGTGWNATYTSGAPITAAPYSINAPADTAFDAAELAEIQKAWQVVAEDYAPFDVNVTTKLPAPGAIERTGSADLIYGTRVLVTGGGPIYSRCGCGGVAYVNTFSRSSQSAYYQPAWVFTNGTSTSGKRLAEAASHEAGHNFGLDHDGASSAYYSGAAPWAPIMGASYSQPVTQWSAGEYPGATNREDDLAVIAAHLAARADDHANTRAGATALGANTPVDGVITTRTDTDAFTFVAAGTTTLTATPGPGFPDLDIGLRILDSSGAVVAEVDPPVARFSATVATGLAASWSATLPDLPGTYTAVVDGVGSGDPTTAGKYSDYGSLGNYRVVLATNGPPPGSLAATSSAPAAGTVGVGYSATPASAAGGVPPYVWSASSALPAGLVINADASTISGTPTAAGSTPVTLLVTDAVGSTATTSFTLTINPAPVQPSTAPPLADMQSPTPVVATVSPVSVAPILIGTKSRTAFSAQLVASGGTGAFDWAATGVPSGVTVSRTGLVAGSVGLPGVFAVPVSVTSGSSTTVTTVTLNVVRRAPLNFATAKRLPAAQVGRSYATTIRTRGAEGRVRLKKSGATPLGFRVVRKAGRLTISGLATKSGAYAFTLVATDTSGARRVRRFVLTINR